MIHFVEYKMEGDTEVGGSRNCLRLSVQRTWQHQVWFRQGAESPTQIPGDFQP